MWISYFETRPSKIITHTHTHLFTISWTICWTNTSGKHLEIGNRLRGPFYAPSINSILFLRYRVYSPISRLLVFAFCAPLRKNFFFWKIINNPSNIYIYTHARESFFTVNNYKGWWWNNNVATTGCSNFQLAPSFLHSYELKSMFHREREREYRCKSRVVWSCTSLSLYLINYFFFLWQQLSWTCAYTLNHVGVSVGNGGWNRK